MRKRKVGFTLVELLVVIAIIGILVALLLPAIQAAREAARRTQCLDHQKNLGLALQNYHDTYKVFPMGAQIAGRPGVTPRGPQLGSSWWYGIMPFIEQRNIYDKIQNTQRSGAANPPVFAAGDLNANAGVANAVANLVPEYMRCPSSPLPVMETQSGPVCLPSYVGISGGCDISATAAAASPDYSGSPAPANWAPVSNRIYINQSKGTLTAGGVTAIVTSSGMLPPAQHINMAGCTDGTSNTMIVGEQSDWLRDISPAITTKFHGDPGWNSGSFTAAGQVNGTSAPPNTNLGGGWVSGTQDAVIQVGNSVMGTNGSTPGTTGLSVNNDGVVASLWNITTVRYKPDLKQVLGATPYPGCGETMGHNNPLQSPHPGGLLVTFVDGSVQFISATTNFAVFLRIAIRDDGQTVSLDN